MPRVINKNEKTQRVLESGCSFSRVDREDLSDEVTSEQNKDLKIIRGGAMRMWEEWHSGLRLQ